MGKSMITDWDAKKMHYSSPEAMAKHHAKANAESNPKNNPIRNGPVYTKQWSFREENENLTISQVRELWRKEKGIDWLTPKQILAQTGAAEKEEQTMLVAERACHHPKHVKGCNDCKDYSERLNSVTQLIYEWVRDEAGIIPADYSGSNKMSEVKARKLLSEKKPDLLPDFEIFLSTIPTLVGQDKQPIANIWAGYDSFRTIYVKPDTGIFPRTEPLQGKKSGSKKRIPMECRRSFPHHVVRHIAETVLHRIDPVLLEPEGTFYQSPKGVVWELILRGDHKEKWNGHNTTPENLQVISNIANNYKLDGSPTHEQIRARIQQAGLRKVEIPADELAVIRKWNLVRIK